MKKILTMLAMAATTTLLHAQGFIIFSGTSANIQTNGATFLPGGGENTNGFTQAKVPSSTAAPGAFDYALLYSSSAIVDGAGDAGWSQVASNGYAAGVGLLQGSQYLLAGGMTGPGATAGIQINVAAGTTVNTILVGWSTSLGSTWAQVLAQLQSGNWNPAGGYFGETAVSTMTPFVTAGAGDPSVFPSIFPAGSLTLYAVSVPEPTTIALASLGGLSLLAFRRRNKKA